MPRFLPSVIQTTEGRKDPGCIAQPEVDVTEILHFVQDDTGGEGTWRATFSADSFLLPAMYQLSTDYTAKIQN